MEYITKCNNCSSQLLCSEATYMAKDFPDAKIDGSLILISDAIDLDESDHEGYFWGCPDCMTDGYLTDNFIVQ